MARLGIALSKLRSALDLCNACILRILTHLIGLKGAVCRSTQRARDLPSVST